MTQCLTNLCAQQRGSGANALCAAIDPRDESVIPADFQALIARNCDACELANHDPLNSFHFVRSNPRFAAVSLDRRRPRRHTMLATAPAVVLFCSTDAGEGAGGPG